LMVDAYRCERSEESAFLGTLSGRTRAPDPTDRLRRIRANRWPFPSVAVQDSAGWLKL